MPNAFPNRDVCALAFDGMPLFEFSIAVELFGLERPEMGPDWYRFHVVSFDGGPCRTTAGLSVTATAPREWLETAGTIIIPGWPMDKPIPDTLIELMQRAHDRGARIVTICSGAFVLAAAGLLKGRRATTHWKYVDYVACTWPDVQLVPDVLYIDEGQILTSAGSAAGIDLCLHLIRRDFGPEAANKVARRLVVPPHRDGGQAQYIPKSVPIEYERNRLGPLLDHMRERLDEPHTVAQLARRAGMSERTFLRRFEEATGTTPSKWLMQIRLQTARDLLEATPDSVDLIAQTCGFGSAANFRHHFRENLSTTPTAYRQTFQRNSVLF
ncbi:transcriptional regulator FtrA [Asticcacaulis sp. AND118]|uniref:transcriptional regulator FtrA n=1 Tax=Asticcacaulis sp. AND118 TaxID=2840468 RepID=UPI001CFFB7F0|nr:transcriptional regulator FtrA [Asticcacaulis sp. AND118]UDF02469.1 transcriptional regulator FtrA [Asticcacaulis sp. AND118]